MPVASDYRIASGITRAERSRRTFTLPKPSNNWAKLGLRYERNVGKELARHVVIGNFIRLEHNPWFTFYDKFGVANCCPDFLLYLEQGVVIVEVKLTYVDVALAKLTDLYCPVISAALEMPVRPLVICRNLTRSAPNSTLSLREALTARDKLLLWPSIGHILW